MSQLDISLSYEDIDRFSADVASYGSPDSIRSLSVQVAQPTLTSFEPDDVERVNTQLEQALLRLAEAIPALKTLQSFSLTVSPEGQRGYHLDISQPALAAILKALPQSCVNLDFDTDGLDHTNGFGEPVHLCDSIRAILPRMRHVRLHLRSMCATLVGTISDGNNELTPVPLPELRTLLIVCKQTYANAPVCCVGVPTQTPASTRYVDPWDSVTSGLERLAHAGETLNRLRRDVKLLALTSTSPDDSDKSVYLTIIKAAIMSRTSQLFPVAFVANQPYSWLMRMAEGREVISLTRAALDAAAEGGDAWITAKPPSSQGVRLPPAVAAEWGVEAEPLPVEDVGVWRAANPRKMTLLWYNETLCGERLLDGETRSGDMYLSRDPLIERTPAGWQRPNVFLKAQLEPADG